MNAAEEALRELLREHFDGVDPAPDRMRTAALAAFAWRDVDRELADVRADSLLTDAPIRSRGGPRLVTFAAGAHTIEIEVDTTGRTRRVVGQVVPAAQGSLRPRSGGRAVQPDALGRFLLTDLVPGPFGLVWEPATGGAYNTAWIDI
ncbi:MAG: hypothetical protein ACT4QF_05565 [Sporichthyaceae bacterium]|jgi:hypothetical protein